MLENVFDFIHKHPWLKNKTIVIVLVISLVSILWLTGILERVAFEASKRTRISKLIKTGIISFSAISGLVAGIVISGKMNIAEGPISLVVGIIAGLCAAVVVFDLLAIFFLIGVGIERLLEVVRERNHNR